MSRTASSLVTPYRSCSCADIGADDASDHRRDKLSVVGIVHDAGNHVAQLLFSFGPPPSPDPVCDAYRHLSPHQWLVAEIAERHATGIGADVVQRCRRLARETHLIVYPFGERSGELFITAKSRPSTAQSGSSVPALRGPEGTTVGPGQNQSSHSAIVLLHTGRIGASMALRKCLMSKAESSAAGRAL
jgi:hypothetical protein